MLCTKDKFGEMYCPSRQNNLHFPQCHVYIFHPMTPLAKFTIFLFHIDMGDPKPDSKTEGELTPHLKYDSLTAVIKHLPGMCKQRRETAAMGVMLRQMFSVMPLDNPLKPWKNKIVIVLFLWVYLIYLSRQVLKSPNHGSLYGKAYSFASFMETDPRTARCNGAFVIRTAFLFATK